MRNISMLVGGSFALVACLLVGTNAFAETCEREERDAGCREYETYMMPGAQGAFYKPSGVASPYVGGGFDLSIVRWSHQNNDYGPSEGNVFVRASLLTSKSSEKILGIYEGGLTLSFERNPNRHYMIPYFGFTTGGMVADDLPKSGFIQPVVGLSLFSNPNVVADIQGGYVFPFESVDKLHGFRAQASLRFHLW